jgi:hypothetical protein
MKKLDLSPFYGIMALACLVFSSVSVDTPKALATTRMMWLCFAFAALYEYCERNPKS